MEKFRILSSMDYPKGHKGYELLIMGPEWSNFINRKCITFSESHKENNSKYMKMELLETMAKKIQLEMEVPT